MARKEYRVRPPGPELRTSVEARLDQRQEPPSFLSDAIPRTRDLVLGLPRPVASALGSEAPGELTDPLDRIVVTAWPALLVPALHWHEAPRHRRQHLTLAAIWPDARLKALDSRISRRLTSAIETLKPSRHVVVVGPLDRVLERALVHAVAVLDAGVGVSTAASVDEALAVMSREKLWRPVGLLVGRSPMCDGDIGVLLEATGHTVFLDDQEPGLGVESRRLSSCSMAEAREKGIHLKIRSAFRRSEAAWQAGHLGWR
jgi:hypothetical protein